jgi:tetratricopeptide (TPR) repeat protein
MTDSRFDVIDLGLRGEFDWLRSQVERLTSTSPGATVFFAGDEGSGATAVLNALAATAGTSGMGPRILSGSFESGEYVARNHLDENLDRARALVEGALTLSGAFIPLVAQIVAAGSGAKKMIDASAARSGKEHSLSLIPELFTSAVRADGPLVCLIDFADRSTLGWWADLMLNLSRQIAVDLPLLLVFAIDGPPRLGPREPDEPGSLFVARQLVGEGIAAYRPLPRHSTLEFEEWIGGSGGGIANLITETTGGRASWSAAVWEEWRRSGAAIETDGRWSLVDRDSSSALGMVGQLQSRRLQGWLGDDLGLLAEAQELLSLAALEGREFDAEALAAVTGRDPDELIDFFDDRLSAEVAEEGFLEELRTITIKDEDGLRHLRRYRFASELDYLFCRHYGTPDLERQKTLALELAQTLHRLYGDVAPLVARTIANLAELGGDLEATTELRRMQYVAADRETSLVRARAAMRLPVTADQNERNHAAELLMVGASALYHSGPWTEGIGFAERGAALADVTILKAGSLYYAAWFATHTNDQRKARRYLVEALEGFRALNSRSDIANALHQIANLDMGEGKFADAEEGYLAALKIRQAIGDRELQARVHEALGDLNHRQEDIVRARHEYELALRISREIGDRLSWANTRWRVAELDFEADRFEECRAPLDEVLAIQREFGDRRGTFPVLRLIANAEFEMGRYEQARDAAAHAARVAAETELDEGPAALFKAGQSEQALGDSAAARAKYLEVLPLVDKADPLAIYARRALGEVEFQESRIAEARTHLEAALRLAVDAGDRDSEGDCRRLLGDLFSEEEKWRAARRSYLLALPLKRQEGHRETLGALLYRLGAAAYEEQDFDDATKYLEEALPHLVASEQRWFEASAHTYRGLIDEYNGQEDGARVRFDRALSIHRETGDAESEAEVLRFISELG